MRISTIILNLIVLVFLVNCTHSTESEIKDQKNLDPAISVNIGDLYQDSVAIKFNVDNINKDSLVFKFQKVISGTYRHNKIKKYINNIQFFDTLDNVLNYKEIDSCTFLIPNSKTLKNISYSVKKGNSNNIYDVLTKIVAVDSFCIINPASFIGYLEDYQGIDHTLNIKRPNNDLFKVKSYSLVKRSSFDSFKYQSYDDLVNNPVLYCMPDTTSIHNKYFDATISIYSDNKNVTANKIKAWIQPLSKLMNNYSSFIPRYEKPYRFIFILSDEFIQESALEQKNASVYCMRSNWDTAFLAKKVQHIVAHEYLHRITPYNFHSNIYQDELYENFSSKHLWLYEGVVEYLALKANLESNTISFGSFIKHLSMMNSVFVRTNSCEEESLLELSKNILSNTDFRCFQNFYYKGGLFAFVLDLQLSIKSKGNDNLIKAIERFIHHNGNIFDENNFFENFLATNNLLEFKEVILSESFDKYIKNSFIDIGYEITNNKDQWIDSESNEFFIEDYQITDNDVFISFDENAKIKNKTIKLIEIEKTPVNKQSVLNKLIYPPNNSPVEITYIEKDKEKQTILKPITRIGFWPINKIEAVAKLNASQKTNLKHFAPMLKSN